MFGKQQAIRSKGMSVFECARKGIERLKNRERVEKLINGEQAARTGLDSLRSREQAARKELEYLRNREQTAQKDLSV